MGEMEEVAQTQRRIVFHLQQGARFDLLSSYRSMEQVEVTQPRSPLMDHQKAGSL